MPKFKFLKEGVNADLMKKTKEKVEKYLKDILNPDELISIHDIYSFKFGTVMVQIRVVPFHSDDCLYSSVSLDEHAYLSSLSEASFLYWQKDPS